MKMINVGREIKRRDYSNEKGGEKKFITETKFPELTIVGKPDLGQLPYGKEIVVKVKLKATGFGQRKSWDCDNEEKIPEANFEIIEMEVPEESMPVKFKTVKQVMPGSKPMDDEGDDEGED